MTITFPGFAAILPGRTHPVLEYTTVTYFRGLAELAIGRGYNTVDPKHGWQLAEAEGWRVLPVTIALDTDQDAGLEPLAEHIAGRIVSALTERAAR